MQGKRIFQLFLEKYSVSLGRNNDFRKGSEHWISYYQKQISASCMFKSNKKVKRRKVGGDKLAAEQILKELYKKSKGARPNWSTPAAKMYHSVVQIGTPIFLTVPYSRLRTWTFSFSLSVSLRVLTCSILDLGLPPLPASWHWHLTSFVSVILCFDHDRKRSDGVRIPELFDNQCTVYVWLVLSQFFLFIKDTHENILSKFHF